LEKVKKKAVEKGLVKKEIVNTLSQKDILISCLNRPSALPTTLQTYPEEVWGLMW